MKCPICKTIDLLMSEKQGVEIDYCPECRGVWLDRTELDKIIERSTSNQVGYKSPDKNYKIDDSKYNEDKYKYNKKQKKESILSEIFDIF